MTPGKIELQREKKPEGSNKLKRIAALLWRWCVGMNVDIVNVQSFFSHFQSCWALLLLNFSKQGGSRWKRYFCFRLLGWSANVTRLHWSSCQCRYLSNWLDDDVPCTPNGQHGLFVFAALGFYIEDFLLSISLKKKMLTALDKRWTGPHKSKPCHAIDVSCRKDRPSSPKKKMGLELAEDL